MKRRGNSDSIPIDLIPDILSRLPEKSIARFSCVSKLWRSLLLKPYFTELFLTRSSSRPRLLIGVEELYDAEWFFFTSPQSQNPSSLVVSADFHTKISFERIIYYILTLGTEKLRWRTIQCPSIPYHKLSCNGICINGVLYYISYNKRKRKSYEEHHLLSCFDVRSEKVKFVRSNKDCYFHWQTKLVNFKGKLGLINTEQDYHGGFPLKLHMWVLEDIDKREFSEYVYTLRTDDVKVVKDIDYISVVGATASGEIVLGKDKAYEPFYVFYFNPERNTLRSVEIQGVRQEGVNHVVHVFVDHEEDLKFDVMKAIYAASSEEDQ
ncbi:F-box protein At1g31080-like [Capsella rubella]|uniref:F-box protein At1g31080-like n=1 Tax=Capsella rubella TaxID=81985 RepID=UPI000CD4DB07|nr:F-box protein At1g31080-like [Capsella rubella]